MNSNYKCAVNKISLSLSKENINITNVNGVRHRKSIPKELLSTSFANRNSEIAPIITNEYSDGINGMNDEPKSELLRSKSTGPSMKKVALIPTCQIGRINGMRYSSNSVSKTRNVIPVSFLLKFDPPKIGVKYVTTESANGIKIEKARVKQITLAHIVKEGVDPDRVVEDLFRCYPKDIFNIKHTKEEQVKELVNKLIEYHQNPKEKKSESKTTKKISRNSITSIPKLSINKEVIKKLKTSRQLVNHSDIIKIRDKMKGQLTK